MKALMALALTIFSIAQADTAPSLKDQMEQIDKTYRALARQISKPDMNPSSIEMFQSFEKLSYDAIPMIPSTVAALPDVEQRKRHIVFQRMMTQLYNLCLDGEEALLDNNNASAKSVLSKMAELKFQGHQIFKP